MSAHLRSKSQSLAKLARIDTMVTVIDAHAFVADYNSGDSLRDRQMGATHSDERELVDLLIDQVEFANVIVLNKTDLVSTAQADTLEAVLRRLNPRARVVRAQFSRVPLDRLLHTRLFDFESAAQNSASWYQELLLESPSHNTRAAADTADAADTAGLGAGGRVHLPETEEYGVSSFVYRRIGPFHES